MEMMNRAIEDAAEFRGLIDKIEKEAERMRASLLDDTQDEQRYYIPPYLRPGENRAERRARLKRERRQAKVAV